MLKMNRIRFNSQCRGDTDDNIAEEEVEKMQLADEAPDPLQAELLQKACEALTKVGDMRAKAAQTEGRQH